MKNDAVHPAIIQQYLLRWAVWWCRTTDRLLSVQSLLQAWVGQAKIEASPLGWLGRGFLMGLAQEKDEMRVSEIGSL